ncbi:hypothetical protein Leryth_003472 [Lithospermum erythrorhizon]|nr:hypothetical protein Leryth_003472 [Lithospermum erythrorhizon]
MVDQTCLGSINLFRVPQTSYISPVYSGSSQTSSSVGNIGKTTVNASRSTIIDSSFVETEVLPRVYIRGIELTFHKTLIIFISINPGVGFEIQKMLRLVTGIAGPSGFGSASTAEHVTQGIDASNLTVVITEFIFYTNNVRLKAFHKFMSFISFSRTKQGLRKNGSNYSWLTIFDDRASAILTLVFFSKSNSL